MALKRAYIFDFDETLVTTDARIHVYKDGVYSYSMNPKEYNFYQRKKGDSLDFSDFNDADLILTAKKYNTKYHCKKILISRQNESYLIKHTLYFII